MTAIVLDERRGLRLVDVKTVLDGLRLVVVTLVHLAAAARAGVHAGRGGVAAGAAGATRAQALDDDAGLNGDEQGGVERATHGGELGVERDGLGGVAREAVEDEALLGVVGLKALLDEVDDQVIGNELALVHVALGLHAELGALLDGGTQKVAGRDVSNAKLSHELLCLGPLARAGGAEKNDVHDADRLS